MALIDRLKGRIETDLDDAELDSMISSVQDEIDQRYGSIASVDIHQTGYRRFLVFSKPIDSITSIAEVEADDTEIVLSANDYRIRDDGRSVERLQTGDNARDEWGRLVHIVYVPQSNQSQRDEITIKLCILDIQYNGLSNESAGDYRMTSKQYKKERAALLDELRDKGRLNLA